MDKAKDYCSRLYTENAITENAVLGLQAAADGEDTIDSRLVMAVLKDIAQRYIRLEMDIRKEAASI